MYDDNNRGDTKNANNAVSILNSIDCHIAFVLSIPDISITSSPISNSDIGIGPSELLETKEDTKIRNDENKNCNVMTMFTSGAESGISKGVRVSNIVIKSCN